MTNPNYDPETNKGTNTPLKEVTLEQLKRLYLVNIDRAPTKWKIPTLDEFIEHYVKNNPGTLVFLEVKEAAAMKIVISTIKKFNEKYPNSNLIKRLIIKFNIALYPNT